MIRTVSSHLELEVQAPAKLVLSITAASDYGPYLDEHLQITNAGKGVQPNEIVDVHGTRLHELEVQAGTVSVKYSAQVDGETPAEPASPADLIRYLRPSRYCESDTLLPTAVAEFSGLSTTELLPAVSSWVGTELSYVPGSSGPTDGAVQTLLKRQGVCRDFAHLTIALLRAMDVPARLVSVYAPGLDPMDFHAVAEAYVEGAWRVVDATTLAPRTTLVRIATGRDAADTAFLTSHGGAIELGTMEVTATADVLPNDDVHNLVEIR